jgi:GNAT superfamily N-acetyltransferase
MIRKVKCTDITAVRALLSQLGYEMDGAEVERRFNAVKQKEDHGVFVVEEEGRVIALLHVYARPAFDKPPEAIVQAIVVDHDARGTGIGKALMGVAEDWASDHGFTSVALTSNVKRSDAHAFYGALGYSMEATSHLFRKNLNL